MRDLTPDEKAIVEAAYQRSHPIEIDPRDTALDEIGRLAMSCWMDMQGRLADDEHRRAHGVLARIAALAAGAMGKV